jgi:hypothetical protein
MSLISNPPYLGSSQNNGTSHCKCDDPLSYNVDWFVNIPLWSFCSNIRQHPLNHELLNNISCDVSNWFHFPCPSLPVHTTHLSTFISHKRKTSNFFIKKYKLHHETLDELRHPKTLGMECNSYFCLYDVDHLHQVTSNILQIFV